MKKYSLKKSIREAAKRERLTDSQREKMLFVLNEYIGLKPIRNEVPQKSSFGALALTFLHAFTARKQALAGTILAFLLLGSGSLAYAAEGSLPGSPLYPIKVGVTEPARSLLATTPSAQAAWHMTLAERRIEEGATLAQQGTLATSTEEKLVSNYNHQIAQTNSALSRERDRDPLTANISSIDFAARLAAYESVLEGATSSSESSNHLLSLRSSVHTDIALFVTTLATSSLITAPGVENHTSSSFEHPDRSVAQHSLPSVALRLGVATDAALKSSADAIGEASSTLDASTSAQMKQAFQGVAALAEQGRALLGQHDDEKAAQAFTDALAGTARLDVLTHAASHLKINLFTGNSKTPSRTSSWDTEKTTSSPSVSNTTSSTTSKKRTTSDRSTEATSTGTTTTNAASTTASSTTPFFPKSTSQETHTGTTSSVPTTPTSGGDSPVEMPTPPVSTPSLPALIPSTGSLLEKL